MLGWITMFPFPIDNAIFGKVLLSIVTLKSARLRYLRGTVILYKRVHAIRFGVVRKVHQAEAGLITYDRFA